MRAAWAQGIEAEGSEGLGECVDRPLELRGFFRDPGSESARRGAISNFSAISDPTLHQIRRAYGKRFEVG